VSFLATLTVSAVMVLGLAIGVTCLFYHRWFCRWLCPMGVCMDAASWAGRSLGHRPYSGRPWGQWIVWLTLAGAVFGFPLLVWLDPLSILSGVFLTKSQIESAAAWASLVCVLCLVLVTVWRPRFWCASACPLGALQDLLKIIAKRVHSTIYPGQNEASPPPGTMIKPLARRAFLGMALGTAGAAVVDLRHPSDSRALHPPGALPHPVFVGLCTRCGNCIRSCPSQIITRDPGRHGWITFSTPALELDRDYCREDCVACTQVCPSGALRPMSLDQKASMKIGLAQVDMTLCLLGDDRECSACRRWCPYEAIEYVFSDADYTQVPVIDPEKCTGCGACQAYCPTQPHKAIVIHRL
jgi:MauM/NapG family ferredoxin protein